MEYLYSICFVDDRPDRSPDAEVFFATEPAPWREVTAILRELVDYDDEGCPPLVVIAEEAPWQS